MTKKILYIWDADYPWDIRVDKICRSLVSVGHEVHIAARNLKCKVPHENKTGMQIHRIGPWRHPKINFVFSFPAFFSPFWKIFIDSIITTNAIDLIIVRDLPMAIAGIWAGKRHGLPVIFDMAEDYVSMLKANWNAQKWKGLNLLVRNPYLAKIVEQYSLKKVDHVFVVTEEAIKVALHGGAKSNNISIVSNTPQLNILTHIASKDQRFLAIRNRFSLIYVGGLQVGRGIQTVLEAIPFLVHDIPDILFVIVGDGNAKNKILQIIDNLNLRYHTLVTGWVPHENIYDYISASKIGIIPHIVNDHVNTTIPNKIFDYMGLGLPIITSNAIPLKHIIDKEECGLTFRSGDPHDFATCVKRILNTEIPFGKNGQRAVAEKYNWPKDESRLLSVIDKF